MYLRIAWMRGIMQKRRNVSSLGRIQRLTRRFAARNDRKWNDIEETMDIIFYIGQALGVITVILGIVNYQVKTRQQVLDKEIVRQRIVDFFEDAFYPDVLHVSVQDFEMEKNDEHTN